VKDALVSDDAAPMAHRDVGLLAVHATALHVASSHALAATSQSKHDDTLAYMYAQLTLRVVHAPVH
jgi:hypothetical protein